MPFREFESRVHKKRQVILTLGRATLWVSVNCFPLGLELRSCFITETRRHREKLKAQRARAVGPFSGKSLPFENREGWAAAGSSYQRKASKLGCSFVIRKFEIAGTCDPIMVRNGTNPYLSRLT